MPLWMPSKARRLFFFLGLILCLVSSTLFARIDAGAIPSELRGWQEWVLFGNEEKLCPVKFDGRALSDNLTQFQCVWPGVLDLQLEDKSLAFSQSFSMMASGWVDLVGDGRYWPDLIRDNGASVQLIDRQGRPSVFLEKGEHRIYGRITFSQIPEYIQLPVSTGLIKLRGSKASEYASERAEDGKLWLRSDNEARARDNIEDALNVRVFRRLTDDLPMRLVTVLQMDVTGSEREMLFGKAWPSSFLPISLDSALPARIENDGMIRVQLRPGRWEVKVAARAIGVPAQLTAEPLVNWPQQELWSFEAVPGLRSVSVSGVSQVDVSQTLLPSEWRHLPTYLVGAGQALSLDESRRGGGEPEANRLTLSREMWLASDGESLIARDLIGGEMYQGWRLELENHFSLGRVSIDGRDQLITRVETSSPAGVEVRSSPLSLTAVSNTSLISQGMFNQIPASGWLTTFDHTSVRLNLLPGWFAIAATGVDDVNGTWVQNWNIWDIFLVLLVVVAVYKTLGGLWAVVGALGIVFAYQEPGIPVAMWLNLCAVCGLLRVAQAGKVRSWLNLYRNLSVLLVLGGLLMFSVQQMRAAIYPQLEPGMSTGEISFAVMPLMEGFADQANAPYATKPDGWGEAAGVVDAFDEAAKVVSKRAQRSVATLLSSPSPVPATPPVSDQRVQTGPAVPQWQWRSVDMSWQSADLDPQASLLLLSPWQTAGIRILMVLMLNLLFAGFLLYFAKSGAGTPINKPNNPPQAAPLNVTVAILVLCFLLGGGTYSRDSYADVPDPVVLKQLADRLTAPPECIPHCADLQDTRVSVNASMLTLALEVGAMTDTWFPLPLVNNTEGFERVLLDGSSNPRVMRGADGYFYIRVTEGVRDIIIETPIRDRERFELNFPMKAHNIRLQLSDWDVSGLVDGILPSNALHFSREKVTHSSGDSEHAATAEIIPFYQVTRTLNLGLEWQVVTEVLRIAPITGPLSAKIALLSGEQVVTPGIKTEDEHVLISFSRNQQRVRWTSRLNEMPEFQLKAPSDARWQEVWLLQSSPVWQLSAEGVPASKPSLVAQAARHTFASEYRPRAGEWLTVKALRPTAVEGQTITIDRTELHYVPGKSRVDVNMTLVMRSSLGERFSFDWPPALTLKNLLLNGRSMPTRQEEGRIDVPLQAGMNELKVEWSEPAEWNSYGLALWEPGKLHFPLPLSNITQQVEPPQDRWLLLFTGPVMGPAVLYWGVIPVLALLAFVLGRHQGNPLSIGAWFLLGVGLSLTEIWGMLAAILLFYVLSYRMRQPVPASKWWFRGRQILLIVFALGCFATIISAIPEGLLGDPDMHIAGNDSNARVLNWYQDRTAGDLPAVSVWSVSFWVYRAVMLLWSLWLAVAIIRWLAWSWGALNSGGFWAPLVPVVTPSKGGPSSEPKVSEAAKTTENKNMEHPTDWSGAMGEQVPIVTHEQDLMAQAYVRVSDEHGESPVASTEFEIKIDPPIADHDISRYLVDEDNLPATDSESQNSAAKTPARKTDPV
ncbi:MAG: hypothetical protein H7A00_03160 [Hahellaceae bacterium]|nr:hypothetical protein [Hahellaceae bacterium]